MHELMKTLEYRDVISGKNITVEIYDDEMVLKFDPSISPERVKELTQAFTKELVVTLMIEEAMNNPEGTN